MVQQLPKEKGESKAQIPVLRRAEKLMRRRIALMLSIALGLGMLAGCGSKAPVESKGESTAAVSGEAAAYKKDVVVGTQGPIKTVDVQSGSNVYHNVLFRLTHDSLVYPNPETGKIEPRLATEWKWIDDNTIEFKLRDGVVFHNGETLKASDVVYTMKRGKELGTTISVKLDGLEACTAVDDTTVQMKLASPNVDWLYTLSVAHMGIVSEKALTEDPEEGGKIGTGAWIVDSYVPSDYVKVKRNDHYWGQEPETETITLKYMPENSARLIALQNGEIDVCLNPNNNELHFIEEDDKLSLVQYDGTNEVFLAFNNRTGPGTNKNLRLALAHCIDTDSIIAAAMDGYAKKALSYWGWNTFGYYDGFGEYGYDLDKAKSYLDQAGLAPGEAKIGVYVSTAERKIAAQIIQESAKQIGLEVEIKEIDDAGLTSLSQYKTASHEAMINGINWAPQGDDVRRAYAPDSNTNKGVIDNARINELMDLAIAEQDEAKRSEYYKELQEIVHDEAYVIPIYYPVASIGINKNVQGTVFFPDGNHDFTQLRVAQ